MQTKNLPMKTAHFQTEKKNLMENFGGTKKTTKNSGKNRKKPEKSGKNLENFQGLTSRKAYFVHSSIIPLAVGDRSR